LLTLLCSCRGVVWCGVVCVCVWCVVVCVWGGLGGCRCWCALPGPWSSAAADVVAAP
jgi:hypothetical protein